MRLVKFIVGLLLLSISPALFAHGGDGMETLTVWFYTLVAIMHGALVLLLHNLMLYKYLWLVIISLLFSLAALVVWWMALTIVLNNLSEEKIYLAASAIGLSLYLIIVIWAIKTPIKQYRQLKGS
jgi:hypothetical protein